MPVLSNDEALAFELDAARDSLAKVETTLMWANVDNPATEAAFAIIREALQTAWEIR